MILRRIKLTLRHKPKPNQTLSNRASRSWIGLNRVLNGFGYAMSVVCGVLGLNAHSMRAARRGINVVTQKTFGVNVFTISEAERQAYDQTARFSKEWFARGGVLGLIFVGVGALSAVVAKGLELTGQTLGISAYSGHTICRALKRCSNYVLGTNFNIKPHQDYIDQHKAKQNPTLSDRASRSWFGLNRVLNGFCYAVSGVLGVLGLSAATYHRGAKEVKKYQNLFADEGKEKSIVEHKAFLTKMKEQNLFTNVTSRANVIRLGAAAIKYGLWFAGAAVSFVCRRAWKLTLGNLIGYACGTDGTFRSTSLSEIAPASVASNQPGFVSADEKSINAPEEKRIEPPKEQLIKQRFRDLLWALKPSGELPDRTEGESINYEQAVRASKQMGTLDKVKWRFAYELRKCASIFSFDSIAEKVILHFASTFKRYVRAKRAAGDFGQDQLAAGFFGAEYRNMVNDVKKHYSRKKEQEVVETVAKSLGVDIS